MISEEKLEYWQRLADEATAGPWEPVIAYKGSTCCGVQQQGIDEKSLDYKNVANNMSISNSSFCASAREAVPALIARVRELEKEANWLAKAQKSCNRSYMTEGVYSYCTRSYDDLKGGQTRCEVCWRETARKAISDD